MAARRLRPLIAPALLVAAIVGTALAVPLLPLDDPIKMAVSARLAAPSAAHWLGQDEYRALLDSAGVRVHIAPLATEGAPGAANGAPLPESSRTEA